MDVGSPRPRDCRIAEIFEIGRPDLDWTRLAKGIGAAGNRVRRVLRAALEGEGPTLIEAPLNRRQSISIEGPIPISACASAADRDLLKKGEMLLCRYRVRPLMPANSVDRVVQPFKRTETADASESFFDLSWRYLGKASCQDGTDKRKLRSFAFERTE